jgi:hypothetical protein
MTPAKLTLLFALTSLVAACGGGSSDNNATGGSPAPAPSPTPPPPAPATVKGKFIDSAVSNLGFSCGAGANATSGVTDGNGAFDYVPTTPLPQCTFSVGGITLGAATVPPNGVALTPYDLVPGATTGNTTVANIARFLQSIDDDGNPANGIGIQAETLTALTGKTLDFSAANFDTLAAAVLPAGKTLVAATSAVAALNLSLYGLYSGIYACTYSAKVNNVDTVLGTVAQLTIAYDTINGIGTPTYPPNGGPYPSFDINGTLTPTGVGVSQTSTGATFNGSFTSNGTAVGTTGDGTWTDPNLGSGTWHCQHS